MGLKLIYKYISFSLIMEHPSQNLEMDIQNLISCIECHKEEKNEDIIIETLKTIVNLCSEEEIGKDAFRDVGGLDFLLQFIVDTDQVFILEFGLKVLAFLIDGNVHSQMHMTEGKVFRILQAIFKKKTYPLSLIKNATVLFSTLLFQNRSAQDIIQENGSLLSLINMYRCFVPLHCIKPIEESEHLDIWLAINSALCFAVNNPLHEKNQETCSCLFSLSLKIIESTSDPDIIEATSSFLSLSIANNAKNQDSFAELDGLQILKLSLIKNFEEIQTCIKECNNMIRKRTLQNLNSLIAIISSTVLDHENNASLCGKLGIVSLMTKLLSTPALNSFIMKKIILVLGYCTDACNTNRFIILEIPNLDVLLKGNLYTDDLELHSASRYLLQVCLNETNKENEINQNCYSETGDSLLEPGQCSHEMLIQHGSGDIEKNTSYQLNSSNIGGLLGIHEHILSENFQNLNTKLLNVKHLANCSQNSVVSDYRYTPKENSGYDSSQSIGNISLHSAGNLYRLCHQVNENLMHANNLEFIQKEKLSKCCTVDEVYNLNTGLEVNNSNIKNMTDCQISKHRNSKNTPDRCSYSSKKQSSTKKSSSFKNKNKGASHQKQSTKPAGCMEVIILPGITCIEHRLTTQVELLKVCPLQI